MSPTGTESAGPLASSQQLSPHTKPTVEQTAQRITALLLLHGGNLTLEQLSTFLALPLADEGARNHLLSAICHIQEAQIASLIEDRSDVLASEIRLRPIAQVPRIMLDGVAGYLRQVADDLRSTGQHQAAAEYDETINRIKESAAVLDVMVNS